MWECKIKQFETTPSERVVTQRHKKKLRIRQNNGNSIAPIRNFHFVVVHRSLFGNLCCNNVPQRDDGETKERETEPLN